MEYATQVASLEHRMIESEAWSRNYPAEEHEAHEAASTALEDRTISITGERDHAATLVHEANKWMRKCVDANIEKRRRLKEQMQQEREIEFADLRRQLENYKSHGD